MNYLHFIYLLLLLFAAATGLYRYRILDTASKVFCWLVGFILVSELTALYTAVTYHNNLEVYNLSIVLQAAIACFYFNYSIDVFTSKKIGIWAGVFSLIAGLSSLMFFRSAGRLNSWFIIYFALLTIAMSTFALVRLVQADHYIKLNVHPHFWFMSIMLLFWACSLLNWTVFNQFSKAFEAYARYAPFFIIVINIFTYSAIGTVFLFYPRMINAQYE